MGYGLTGVWCGLWAREWVVDFVHWLETYWAMSGL